MSKKGFFSQLISLISGANRYEEIDIQESYLLERAAVRVPLDNFPIRVTFSRLHMGLIIFPEIFLDAAADHYPESLIVCNADQDKSVMQGFIRIDKKGDTLILGSHDDSQSAILNYPDNMDLRRLKIVHDGDALIFQSLVIDAEIYLVPFDKTSIKIQVEQRKQHLKTIRDIYGGSIEPLSESESLNTIKKVNELLEVEAYRPLDNRGKPGGVVEIPTKLVPVIVGDLHAQVDNLLTLLSQNNILTAMEEGTAVLVILGDAVHSEVTGELDKMDSSLLMMDLIFKLMIRFPQQVFYIRGNHDSFSKNIFKEGVAQCLMWEHAIRGQRGEEYLHEVKRFYKLLPYVVMSKDYVACHAAPIRTHFDKDMLVNIYEHQGLVRELTRNRLRQRNYPAGYHKRDVHHFKMEQGVSMDTQFLVSHSPLNRKDPLWREAGRIKDHHIVFSANIPWIGVFTRVHNQIVPLSYHQEPIGVLIKDMD